MFNLFPISRGIHMMRQQRYADARRHFESLIRSGVKPAAAHFNCGVCCFKMRDITAARQHLHAALMIDHSPAMTSDILEITNWRMIASHEWFNAWPQFSFDGKRVVYTSARKSASGERITGHDRAGLYIYDLARKKEICLKETAMHYMQPRFSPAGNTVSCLSVRDGSTDQSRAGLYLIDTETGDEHELLGPRHRIKYQQFTPDGRHIIISGWAANSSASGIYKVDCTTGSMETLVQGTFETTFPDISSGGDRLVYSSWRSDTNSDGIVDFRDYSAIYLKSIFDGNETPLVPETYNSMFPHFSPDGRYVLYLSIRRDTNGDGRIDMMDNAGIYLYDLHKHREHCLVDDDFYNKFPVFTPDGKRVIFVSNWRRKKYSDEVNDKLENKGVYMTDLSGRNIVRVMSDKYYCSRSPVASPTGNQVAYVSWRKNTGRGLYVASIDELPLPEQLHAFIDANL
ncbi:MAG: hypothetical protein ABSH12_00040 [Endomicrobiales bacterium]|jgi:Tol biopolymer transport system component